MDETDVSEENLAQRRSFQCYQYPSVILSPWVAYQWYDGWMKGWICNG